MELAQSVLLDPPEYGDDPHIQQKIKDEEENMKTLITFDQCYWDLSSPECTRYRLSAADVKSTSPEVNIYKPKTSFKELPSRHIGDQADPTAMVESVSVDLSDYVFMQQRKFEYDPIQAIVTCHTTMNAEADEVVDEVIRYLSKVINQSLIRHKEFGLAIPKKGNETSITNSSAIKGRLKLYQFVYLHQADLREFPVTLAFLPIWDHSLLIECSEVSYPITLKISLKGLNVADKIAPAFSLHDELVLNVRINVSAAQVVNYCVQTLNQRTSGKAKFLLDRPLGLMLKGVLIADEAVLGDLRIVSSEEREGSNEARLVFIDGHSSPPFMPNGPWRFWRTVTVTLTVDVSEIWRFAHRAMQQELDASRASHVPDQPEDSGIKLLSSQISYVKVNFSLLSTPEMLLEEVANIVHLVFGREIQPKSAGKSLVLKAIEEELYLTEDHQLQFYDIIRNIVAEGQNIILKLSERPLENEKPAVNFMYNGVPPWPKPVDQSLINAAAKTENFTLKVKRLTNLQALFKNLDQVISDDFRVDRKTTCRDLFKSKGKITPEYISPNVVYKVKSAAENIDMSEDSPEEFLQHANKLLKQSGIDVALDSTVSIVPSIIIGLELKTFGNYEKHPLQDTIELDSSFVNEKMPLSNLPEVTRVAVELHSAETVLACGSFALFERLEDGSIQPRFGEVSVQLWPLHKVSPEFVTMLDFSGLRPSLSNQYATIVFDVPYTEWKSEDDQQVEDIFRGFSLDNLRTLAQNLSKNPVDIETVDKGHLYSFRHLYKSQDIKLIYFLKSVTWTNVRQRKEARNILKEWISMSPEDAVCLLGAEFPDQEVRVYAVELVSRMENNDLINYIPQLAQALLFELRHDSALERFLLKRALEDPFGVGHELYWCLRSQLGILPFRERLHLVLERFTMHCGNYRTTLATELKAVSSIIKVIEYTRLPSRMDETLRKAEAKRIEADLMTRLPESFIIPTSTTRILMKEDIKCTIMDSKLKPLKITFGIQGAPDRNYQAMFKTGDDLRQDMLILQIFRIMEKTWRDAGHPVRMKTYRVVAISQKLGLIEIVQDSTQIAKIQMEMGGLVNRRSAWIHDYIAKKNGDYESLKRAQENFMISCACYCAATYILGIGDRHDGNIMIDSHGVMFHIDFGHILGHFKKKWTVRRERYKVKFSEDMYTVLSDSNTYKDFLVLSQKLYNSIRLKGYRLFYLMKMMAVGGMPELKGVSDLEYFIKRLKLEQSIGQVKNLMKRQVEKSMKSWLRYFDRLMHNVAHEVHCMPFRWCSALCHCAHAGSSSS